MNTLKIKVCGMKDDNNIKELMELQPDYMGFIFYEKSKRDVQGVLNQELLLSFPKSIKKTGVFVNASTAFILEKVETYQLDAVQLHGQESPEQAKEIKDKGLEVFKAFSVGETFAFAQLESYKGAVDYFLFDTKGKEAGGNGFTFDWTILNDYDNEVPFLLSGGLDGNNIEDVKKLSHLNIYAVDVNSKFETEPALKDIDMLKSTVFKAFK